MLECAGGVRDMAACLKACLAKGFKAYWWAFALVILVGVIVDGADWPRLWTGLAFLAGLSYVIHKEQSDEARSVPKAILLALGSYFVLLIASFLLYLLIHALWALMGLVTFNELGM